MAEDKFRQIGLLLLTSECYDEFFLKFNFTDVPCLKAALSKCLGIAIILGSMLVKVPQIAKICQGKSGEGISIVSVCLELFAISSNVAYSYMHKFPISSWGEGLFLSAQTSTIAFLVLFFGTRGAKGKKKSGQAGSLMAAIVFAVVYSIGSYVLMSGYTPIDVLWVFQAANLPVILCGKLIQAYSNYRSSSTGQLSAATVFLLFFGSLARVFTSAQETGDKTLIVTYLGASLANAIIAFQVAYYWPRPSKKERRKKKE